MSYRIICDRDDPAWLDKRRECGVGSSESPVILGLSKRTSIVSIYAEKCGVQIPEPKNQEALWWGRTLEEKALERYFEQTGEKFIPFQQMLQSIEHPYLTCTPDATRKQFSDKMLARHADEITNIDSNDYEETFAEIKVTAYRIQEWKDGGVPPDVNCQCQHVMAITGGQEMRVMVLFFPFELVYTTAVRDDAFINDLLIPKCRSFWDHVKNKSPLPQEWIDGSDKTSKALELLFSKSEPGGSIELDGEYIDVFKERQQLKAQEKELKEKAGEIDNKFKLLIGENETAILPDGSRVVWSKGTKSRRISYKASAASQQGE